MPYGCSKTGSCGYVLSFKMLFSIGSKDAYTNYKYQQMDCKKNSLAMSLQLCMEARRAYPDCGICKGVLRCMNREICFPEES